MIRFFSICLLGLFLFACNPVENTDANFKKRDIEAALNASDIRMLNESLKTIQRHHLANKTGVRLNKGISLDIIDKLEEELQCKIPRELKEVWKWRNGEESQSFIWYHRFLSADDALAQYQELTSNSWSLWQPDWIPVFEFEGEWYGVQCSEKVKDASPVIFYFVEDEPRVAYVNLTRYMATMAEAMEKGALTWDGIGWKEDDFLFQEIYSKLNPSTKFPYSITE